MLSNSARGRFQERMRKCADQRETPFVANAPQPIRVPVSFGAEVSPAKAVAGLQGDDGHDDYSVRGGGGERLLGGGAQRVGGRGG